ncbi:MAG: SusC/RagA family TonB-linked outer membrane protein [Cyclobacteriaceae bacterium]|nr:SusC/RagA family TonB-linked outer membrane protein [Cyclobacteriaceae bacterium]
MKRILLICAIALFAFNPEVWSQERTITGMVSAEQDRSPVPGVNVILKGSTTGTVTDIDGKYSLSVPQTGGVLVFSFIGLATEEVAIGNQTVINMVMTADIRQLTEIVVTALGVEREAKALGFSVTQIENKELVQGRATNLANSLTAKVAGLRVQGSNGMVGSSANIFIRGFTTFSGSNQPLFIVDGIPISNAGGANALQNGVSNSNRAIDINQDDIESISVLKGPAAAVLYGSRAAAGAIIITTKKGKADGEKKNTVTFTSNVNLAEANRFPDWQNIYGQGDNGVFSPISINSWGPRAEGQTVTNFRGEEESLMIYPNNIKDIFRTGVNLQNNISLSGASGRSTYFLSYGNLKETGIIDNNELVRNNLAFNGSTQFTEKFRSSINVMYSNNQSVRTQQGNNLANPFFRTWFLPRSYNLQGYPFEGPNGIQRSPASASDLTPNNTWYGVDDNPLWSIKNNRYNDNVDRLIGSVSFAYDLADNLVLDYRIGTDTYTETIKRVMARGSRGGAAAGQTGTIEDNIFTSTETSSYLNLTYDNRFADGNFGFRALVGNEINDRKTVNNGIVGSQIQIVNLDNINNTLVFNPYGTFFQRRLIGVYGDFQLDWKNALFLGITGRNDWSSTFGPDNRSFFYPSVSTSVVISELLPNMQNDVLSFVKFRANYAKVGRESPFTYATDTYFGRSGPVDGFGPSILFPFRDQLGQTYDNTGGNPFLGPEFTSTFEVGTDLRFFEGRISLDVAYFNQRSTDIIFTVPVAGASGFTNVVQNIGESESEGWEVLLNATPVKTSNFRWDASVNWTRIRNRVLSLAPGVDQITLGGFVSPSTRLIAGQPYGVIFGSVFQRHSSGELLIDGNGLANLAPTNQIVGDPNPDWFGGITNTFTYKGLSLTTLVDIRVGGDIISRNISDMRRSGAAAETAERDRLYVIDGVDSEGNPNRTQIRAQQYWDNLYGFGRSEFVVFDASWVRLRELALTYTLPKQFIQNTFIGNVELGLTGRNLLLYAPNVPHLDPEVNAQGQSNSQGLEFNALPQTRTYGALLRVTF